MALIIWVGMIGIIPLTVSAEDATPTFRLSDSTAIPGEMVYVQISLDGSPGVTSLKLKLSYDAEALTLMYVEQGLYENGYFQGSESYDANPYVMVWLFESSYTSSNALVTIAFRVSETAAPGNTPLILTVSEAYNGLDSVTCQGTEGAVSILDTTWDSDEQLPVETGNNPSFPGEDLVDINFAVVLKMAIAVAAVIVVLIVAVILLRRKKRKGMPQEEQIQKTPINERKKEQASEEEAVTDTKREANKETHSDNNRSSEEDSK
jgi:hypothetical protein